MDNIPGGKHKNMTPVCLYCPLHIVYTFLYMPSLIHIIKDSMVLLKYTGHIFTIGEAAWSSTTSNGPWGKDGMRRREETPGKSS